jgi:hypothetical protein
LNDFTHQAMEALVTWIKQEGIDTSKPIQLELTRKKHVIDRKRSFNNEVSYFRVCIDGHDVSGMVANAAGFLASTASATRNCVVVRANGEDVGAIISRSLYKCACDAGYPELFDRESHK